MFSLRKNKYTEKLVHTDCTQKFYRPTFLHAETLPRAVFTQRIFYFAQKPLRKKEICIAFFTDRRFLHTENFLHGSRFTHRRFYTQHFLNTDAFTHRCLCTGTNCTQKLVHIARVYTQPTFTRRGFVSPSCSPTFRVPPQVYFLIPHSYAH